MLKKIESMAQQAATTASRRGFLRSLGKVAAGAAMAAAGVLAGGSPAFGARGGNGGGGNPNTTDPSKLCCDYGGRQSRYRCSPPADYCEFIGCGAVVHSLGCIWDCNGVQELTFCG